ncbi:HHL212Wp [Eremothecium sinecaudum]|uniref:HHL212Wp n=1 Tax=Eremothecium sinecaudum TaxID=45286 RepID=A0A109V0H2_9SACH|nr:HHL212Wp [Eremothecium sinecaudum]AMD22558.1 HHL212Wp [Eremothecium sinecaudum]
MVEPDGKVVKTRRKVSKSCVFCRKRRVKCDKARPKCSTCIAKGLPECVYLSEFTHDVNSRELFSSTPNVELLIRIDQLETELARMKSELTPLMYPQQQEKGETVDPLNKLSRFHLVIEKQGRTIFYGPTSYRAVVASVSPRFYKYFTSIWKYLRKTRSTWKKANQYSAMSELDMIETPILTGNARSILEALCLCLPSYEVVERALNLAFKSPFYRNLSFLDRDKVMQDFYTCFMKGTNDLLTGESPIIRLIPTGKKNYYTVGVIVVLLCIIHFGNHVPLDVELFIKYLSTSFNGKVFYVERVEFFVLRFYYRNLFGKNGGDCIHTVFFAEEAITTAIHMGFHKDINDLYKNHPVYKDRILYLENLWHWVLFIDVEVSLSMGVPLHISEKFVTSESILDRNTGSLYFLKEVIVKFRSILNRIYSPVGTPDLKALIEEIREFVRRNYKSLSFYLDGQNLTGQEYMELESLMFFMSTMFHLAMVNLIINDDRSPVIFATILQYILFTIKLTMVVIQRYFDLDSVYYPERVANPTKLPLIHLHQGISLMAKMSPRSIAEYYTLLFDLHTCGDVYSERNGIPDVPVSETFDLDIKSLEVPDDHHVSIPAAAAEIDKLFDDFLSGASAKLLSVLKRTYPFVVMTSLERICKVVLQGAFESQDTMFTSMRNQPTGTYSTSNSKNVQQDQQQRNVSQQYQNMQTPPGHAYPVLMYHSEQSNQGKQFTGNNRPYVGLDISKQASIPTHPALYESRPRLPEPSQPTQFGNVPNSVYSQSMYLTPGFDQQIMKSVMDQVWTNFDTEIDDWVTTSNGPFNQFSNLFKVNESQDEEN